MTLRQLCMLLVMWFALPPAAVAETLRWHQQEAGYPPFTMPVSSPEPGLYEEMLSRVATEAGVAFERVIVPTARADMMFLRGELHLRVLVNPDWLSEEERRNSLFTAPLFQAQEILVFPAGRRFPFDGRPGQLRGKRIATVTGYRYPLFADEFDRVDSAGELTLLRQVAAGRVDAGIVNATVAAYLVRLHGLTGIERGPVYLTGPRVLRVHPSKEEAFRRLDEAVRRLAAEDGFQAIIDNRIAPAW